MAEQVLGDSGGGKALDVVRNSSGTVQFQKLTTETTTVTDTNSHSLTYQASGRVNFSKVSTSVTTGRATVQLSLNNSSVAIGTVSSDKTVYLQRQIQTDSPTWTLNFTFSQTPGQLNWNIHSESTTQVEVTS